MILYVKISYIFVGITQLSKVEGRNDLTLQ